jgi:hypothetical protein
MTVNRQALQVAQTVPPEPVHADDGIYAGLLYPTGRWACGSCMSEGVGGRRDLLLHDMAHQDGAA